MVPARILPIAELPLTSSGKADSGGTYILDPKVEIPWKDIGWDGAVSKPGK